LFLKKKGEFYKSRYYDDTFLYFYNINP
jgi:hypothetical protein